jgi:hypothetical protein
VVRVSAEAGNFLFVTVSRSGLGPNQPPIQCVPAVLIQGVKQRLRMHGSVPPFPQYVFMTWCLAKHKDKFTFTFRDELYI